MEDKLILEVSKLNEMIKNSDEYHVFKELDLKIKNSDEVLLAAQKLQKFENEYGDAIKNNLKNSDELQRKVYEASKKLNDIPLVKQYNKAYLKLKEIYDQINIDLIYPFNVKIERGKND